MNCPTPGKKAYPSKKAARLGLRGLDAAGSKGPGRLHVYKCGGHWHVGHTPWGRRRAHQ